MTRDAELGKGSTRWRPVRETIASGAAGTRQHPRSGYRWFGCYRWPRDQKLTLTITYRAGAECWYLVEGRGRKGVFPGVVALHDVLQEVMQ